MSCAVAAVENARPVAFLQFLGQDHPKRDELQQQALGALAACAEAREVPPDKFLDWFKSERLNDPDHFLPALDRALQALVPPDAWLFDRALLTSDS